jgi:hypothetical protein
MTNYIGEHLKKLEAAIQNAKPILEKNIAEYNMQDKRTLNTGRLKLLRLFSTLLAISPTILSQDRSVFVR